jgi:Skp family chaperone for outer membrane proteins
MSKTFPRLLLIALLTLIGSPSYADLRIATVDLSRIINETNAAKDQREKLNSLSETLKEKTEAKTDELKTLEARLESNKESKTYAREIAAFQIKRRDFARFLKDSEDELKREMSRINQELTASALKEIRNYAQKNGFDLVVTKSERQRGPILFGPSGIDITDQLLTRSQR